jgi:hypothetical protein
VLLRSAAPERWCRREDDPATAIIGAATAGREGRGGGGLSGRGLVAAQVTLGGGDPSPPWVLLLGETRMQLENQPDRRKSAIMLTKGAQMGIIR